jgi:hypothetical protein
MGNDSNGDFSQMGDWILNLNSRDPKTYANAYEMIQEIALDA